MDKLSKFFSNIWGLIISGAVLGAAGPLLVLFGNPGNMGICIACFLRDTAGALGLHRFAPVQYIRPELIGLVLGAFVAALIFGEHRPKGGSSPVIRFMLGFFAMVGALVFLGCPWRAYFRLAGGDMNALIGIAGLVAGVVIAMLFFRSGFSLGKAVDLPKGAGWIMPAIVITLLVFAIVNPLFAKDASGASTGPIFKTADPKAVGGMVAPIAIAIVAGLVIGFLVQRSRFCSIGAIRNSLFFKDFSLLWGVIAMIVVAFVMSLIFGTFKLGFEGQPVAHADILWNFAGMFLAGIALTLAGGCPARMLILSGEGDNDAVIFIFGMVAGSAFGMNMSIAANAKGIGANSPMAIIIGLAFCIIIGLTMKEKVKNA